MKKFSTILITAVAAIAGYETLKKYGVIDQINGKIEQAIGKNTDDPETYMKGLYHEGKGSIKEAFEDTKDAVEDALDDLNHPDA